MQGPLMRGLYLRSFPGLEPSPLPTSPLRFLLLSSYCKKLKLAIVSRFFLLLYIKQNLNTIEIIVT